MEPLMSLLEATLASPWLYLVVLAAVALDVLLPVVPGEAVVITAGTAVMTGTVDPAALVLAAAAGALLGDAAAHQLGRGAGPLARRLRRWPAADALFRWAATGLAERGTAVVLAGRFVPGGRTAVALTSGLVRVPRRRFLGVSAAAGVLWSVYGTGLGMLGGAAFREQPLLGAALGIGLALVLGGGAELLRSRRDAARRSRAARGISPGRPRASSCPPAAGPGAPPAPAGAGGGPGAPPRIR